MANEVVIEEYSSTGLKTNKGVNVPLPSGLSVTQTLNITTASAAFASTTTMIRLQSKGTGFWYALGGASPTCTANTSPARWLPADQFRDIVIVQGTDLKIQTAA